MFVRKNRNRSGTVSIQIISKQKGSYQVVQTVGCSRDPDEIERLVSRGESLLRRHDNQLKLFSLQSREAHAVKSFVEKLSNRQIHTLGPELIFGALFDRIGFGILPDQLFRDIVIARLAYPSSKLKTVDYLYRYRGIQTNEDTIYRFLDKLQKKYKTKVERIAYQYTQKTLKTISIVFYDITTLYFEAEDEDDLRKIGFSKDGKFQHPQIMLGLLVGKRGYPIGYDIFEGNTFEGHTLMPTLKKIQKKYNFKKPTVVADAALLSKKNLKSLGDAKYRFIVGGRIKNEAGAIQAEILKRSQGIQDGDYFIIKKEDGTKLVVTYSTTRAKKDAYNRERGIRKLKKRIQSGRLTKENLNNRGYNKFLKLAGEISIILDEDKVKADQKWDGLKGYITNTRFSAKTIVENYRELWQIEKAFRISKTDLRIRPIYHYRKRRIESHLCIAFVAYTIYKELERLLNRAGFAMSPKRAAELTHNMYELEYILPGEALMEKTLLKMDPEQQKLYNLIHNKSGAA
jgi:transposase